MFDDFAQGDEIVARGQDGFVGGIVAVVEGDRVPRLLKHLRQRRGWSATKVETQGVRSQALVQRCEQPVEKAPVTRITRLVVVEIVVQANSIRLARFAEMFDDFAQGDEIGARTGRIRQHSSGRRGRPSAPPPQTFAPAPGLVRNQSRDGVRSQALAQRCERPVEKAPVTRSPGWICRLGSVTPVTAERCWAGGTNTRLQVAVQVVAKLIVMVRDNACAAAKRAGMDFGGHTPVLTRSWRGKSSGSLRSCHQQIVNLPSSHFTELSRRPLRVKLRSPRRRQEYRLLEVQRPLCGRKRTSRLGSRRGVRSLKRGAGLHSNHPVN